jgi:putative Mn2+ efflux pump MntP
MHSTSLLLLLAAAGIVAILHSLLPDHWVPLAVVARTQRWSILYVIRVTFLAALGHVISSLVLAGIIAWIGLQFQHEIETQQGHIVGIVLSLTGIIFLISGLLGHGHNHGEGGHTHTHKQSFGHKHDGQHAHDRVHEHVHDDQHNHNHDHTHTHTHATKVIGKQPLVKRMAAIAVPFGVAASPDLTILPVALAASAIGIVAITSVLSVFMLLTIATFIGLTVIATLAGYQIKGEWLEKNAHTITSLVLIIIGFVAYMGF